LKKLVTTLITLGTIVGVFTACTNTNSVEEMATVQGNVFTISGGALQPVTGALVSSSAFFVQTKTDEQGHYQLTIDLSNSKDSVTVDLDITKAGFQSVTTSAFARKGKTSQVPDVTLISLTGDTTATQDTSSTSGKAAHIEVSGSHPTQLFVQSSGLRETARIDFKVTDAQGRPVSNKNRVKVEFVILNGPGGGEYLSPDTMTTRNGAVFTVVNSGIRAGGILVEARATVDGKVIRTTPVQIAVFGGLPDASHFSVALNQINIAGRVHFGLVDQVTAFVGDKFSNPVAPGTVVYFSTDYGIVEGAASTDELGRATVRYISASPLPPNPQDSTFAHITASTFTDTLGQNRISTRGRLLLSDVTAAIQVSPSSFQYNNNNTPIQFSYSVSDIWGNPIVADSRVDVAATDGRLLGDVSFKLLDTQAKGPGTTQFSFTWAPGDSLKSPQVLITINIASPANGNGNISTSITGVKTGN